MRTLLVDNYDSFTYNLFHQLAEVNGREPEVIRNDDPRWRAGLLASFDNVVVSPGPGHPGRAADFGICREIIEESRLPLLGICLGHQGIGLLNGAAVGRAPEPFHGRVSAVLHGGDGLFAGVPSPMEAVRYHSLRVTELPPELEAVAWTPDGVLMALRHRERPQWGVQFHPESICSQYGVRLLGNFAELSRARREHRAPRPLAVAGPVGSARPVGDTGPVGETRPVGDTRRPVSATPADTGPRGAMPVDATPADSSRAAGGARGPAARAAAPARHMPAPARTPEPAPAPTPVPVTSMPDTSAPVPAAPETSAPEASAARQLRVLVETLPTRWDGEIVYDRLFRGRDHAFWLDSSRPDAGRGRFSVMGDASGPLARVARADVWSGTVTVRAAAGTEIVAGPFLDWIDRDLRSCRTDVPELPCGFALGWVGYLGYELKAECGGEAVHRSQDPDATMVFADRAVVFDHATGMTYLLALAEEGSASGGVAAARAWLTATADALAACGVPQDGGETPTPAALSAGGVQRPEPSAGMGVSTAQLSAAGVPIGRTGGSSGTREARPNAAAAGAEAAEAAEALRAAGVAASASGGYQADRDAEPLGDTGRALDAYPAAPTAPDGVEMVLRHDHEAYLELIAECQRQIAAGETYEVCLTNMAEVHGRYDPWTAYRTLRRTSPVPFGALLQFDGLAVLSTSPERFVGVSRDGLAVSEPIKGTRPRGRTPEADAALAADLREAEKDRSENLMIVDLVRNDLGRCAVPGSVEADEIFRVESYATTHQLVSTVRARLRPGLSAVECVRAAFPGGSMTGAPKKRTMELIDRLEGGPRGVYSGAIGYFSLTGAADLSIVIRTALITEDRVRYGVGGAVIALSDPEAEFEETAVKAAPLLAITGAVFPRRDAVSPHGAASGPERRAERRAEPQRIAL
ncbi:aminodeoxychorismate synthase component I [Streptomyces sp. MUM 178J]|uniref:aminodeoxychorismate synthase component I n=1 Tax=Streptomyces sp. MUM 178J TaxID=2791991 RepID=UPI001F04BA76|nr:aminodeoxychorismate synthase component I [Streptomyces sp. MUM 178J]WRQ82836.1 aminodeoxychorismate synthase component I [Streptomyces sp. MUM 178J]